YAGDPKAERSRQFFAKACELDSGEGCYFEAVLSGQPYLKMANRYQKACQLGFNQACTEDGGCLQAQETGVSYGGCNERGECEVAGSTSTGNTAACQRLCSAGMPGACHRLEVMYSWCEESHCKE